MKNEWQLHEAKNRFSEVVERAIKKGPQTITRRGRRAVFVVSAKDFQKLSEPSTSLVDFLRSSPLAGVELDIERDEDTGREVAL